MITSNAGHQQEIWNMIELSIAITILDFNISTNLLILLFSILGAKLQCFLQTCKFYSKKHRKFLVIYVIHSFERLM